MPMKLFAMLFALLMTSCANYTPRINPAEKPQADDAFVYGRFYIEADGNLNIGLLLQCANGTSYTVGFNKANPVHVIKVKPDTCSVVNVVFSDSNGQVRSKKPFSKQILQKMRFKAGTAYYIGDFFAYTNVMQELGSRFIRTEWQINKIKSDFRKTTAEMQSNYSGISHLMTEDLMGDF